MDRFTASREEPADASPDPFRDFDIAPRAALDLRDVPILADLAPDMNSRDENPLRDDGGKPLFVIQNTSRRQDTPRDTRETAETEAEPPPAERLTESGPEVPRDAQAVLYVVRMRALSFDQLSRLTYFGGGITVARRRLRRLRARGWIDVWEKPVAQGGAPRYAYPTRRALQWADSVNERIADSAPSLEKIIRLMTPSTPRQPWRLEAGVIPMFLAHTEEANEVLIGWLRRSAEQVLWASSWDCPFPEHVEWRTMPQPDYVIVLKRDGRPQLVFGEHDRGTESREVVARKFRIYQTWKETPDIAERIFGFRSFHVFVTVSGDRAQRRLDQLAQLARVEGVGPFTTFMQSGRDAVPALPPLITLASMDFTHCRLCQTRVPLRAEVCPSCGAPTHQLARDEYAAETDAPDIENLPSEPPLHPPP